jgi:hypothetical protein
MSQQSKTNNLIYSAPVTLVNGIGTLTNSNLNATTDILSIYRLILSSTGAIGAPRANLELGVGNAAVPLAGADWRINVTSTTTDNSTYNVYWVNSYNPSQLYAQSGSGVGVQYPG